MKFHNQRDFMGHKISNVTNKPLLHKKGKQWIVVAVSALILAGFGGVVSTTTHADTTTNNGVKTESAASNSANNKPASASNTQNQAKALHINLLQNANAKKPSNLTAINNKGNNSNNSSNKKPAVHLLSSSSAPADELAPKGAQQVDQGMWGNAYWNFYDNGQLDIHDGKLNRLTTPQLNSIESKITSIKTYNDTAPNDMSGMFGAGMGNHSNYPGNMPESDNQFTALQDIDLSGLDTSNVTNMDGLFHGASSLQHITFGHTFDTSKVSDFSGMFVDDTHIQYLDLSSFNTSHATNLSYLFNNTPSLRVVDLSNFVASPGVFQGNGNTFTFANNGYSNGTWGHHLPNSLHQLIIGKGLNVGNGKNQTNLQSLGLTKNGVGNHVTLQNIAIKNSPTLTNSWSDVHGAGNYIDTSDEQNYTVYFYDESNNNNLVGTPSSYTGVKNAPFLPVKGITLPNGYQLAPNAGTTANVINGNTAAINVVPTGTTATGTWGSANWLLYNNGKLVLLDGALETPQVPNESNNDLYHRESGVTSIVTNNVIAPRVSNNLFNSFKNAGVINLTGMDFSSVPASDISNMLPSDKPLVQFNPTIDGDLYENLNNTSSMAQSNSGWINNNSANLSSASNSASDADNWVKNNSNSAQSTDSWVNSNSASANSAESWVNSYGSNASNAGSWYAKNSASVNSVVSSFNSVSNSAQSAYNYYSQSSASISNAVASLGSLNSAWTSASNAWSYVSSQSSSISTAITNANDAVNDYNNDTKSSLSTAYASANSAYTSLTSQKGSVQSAISRLNSMNNSFATAYNSATNAESYLEKNSGSFATLSSDISKDNTNLSNAIANKADNSTLTADSNALNTAINNAQSWINSNSASLNNASNEANEASNSAKTNASDISSNSSSIASLSTNANTNSANATSSVNSLSNSANAGISNNSSSITSLSNSANTVESNNSANASSSVNSLSNSANNTSASASKGIASNATRISNNSNNINTNSKTASNGIYNANASASASASVASSNAQSVANQNSASASISAFNANSNADSYALSLAQNATGVANANAGGIDNTMSYDDQTVQSLSNTVNANTISLANNDNDLYQSKENKPATKKHGVKIAQLHQPLFYFYALKPLWLHTSAKFTKGNRAEELSAKHGYTLPITRIFKVNGALRFEVKIDGAKYFVTGNRYFTRNAYIQPNEVKHNSSVKVLKAIREYKRAGFGKKNFIKGIRKGTVLPIKQAKTVANKQVTRLQLTNGHWITANKNLVKLI